MKLRYPLAVLCLSLASTAPAQLRINEILIDPAGPNAGNQIIELVNTSNAPFTPIGWTFCIRPAYPAIPQIEVPAGGIVQVHIGAVGVNTATDWFMPLPFGTTELPANGEFNLYSTAFLFTSPTFLEDFVSWGTGVPNPVFQSRIDIAVAAGKWPSTTTHMPLPAEGSTAAWFGTGFGPSAYFADSTPTLGQENQPASFAQFGVGCLVGGELPVMDIVSPDLPWLDESFDITIGPLPPGALAFGVLGLSDQFFGMIPLPQDLGLLGFPGCLDYVSADFITPALPEAGGVATWTQTIPSTVPAAVIGLEFFTQGVVLSGVQGGVSNAASLVLGGLR